MAVPFERETFMRSAFLLVMIALWTSTSPAQDGARLYTANCSTCHNVDGRAPPRSTLRQLTPYQVLLSLDTGSMREIAAKLTPEQRASIAFYVGNKAEASSPTADHSTVGRCTHPAGRLTLSGPRWLGWGPSLANDRFQRTDVGMTREDVPTLKLRWTFGFAGDPWAVSEPVVAGGQVFIGSASGLVYALDLKTGCTYWTFKADGPVRTALSIGRSGSKAIAFGAFFSDAIGNAYRLNPATGKLIWKVHVDDHRGVRTVGSPQLYESRLYVPVSSMEEVLAGDPKYECCTFRGSVVALDAASGRQVWRAYSISDKPQPTERNAAGTQMFAPSGAATYSAPTIDPRLKRLYFTTGNSYSEPAAEGSDSIIGVDLQTGGIVWSTQLTRGDAFNAACLQPNKANCPRHPGSDSDFASPAMLITTPEGKRLLIAGQKSGMVYALDPDENGKEVWSTRVGVGGFLGGVMWGSASDGGTVYVAISDSFAEGRLNPDAGGLVALRSSDGRQIWRIPTPPCGDRVPCLPAQTAAVTLIPGVVFSGSRDGFLRAYSSVSGRILWEYSTAGEFETVNGVRAKGGTLDVSGATAVDGTVLTTSGYPQYGGIAGNVLLAFSVDTGGDHPRR
jgi:polyvinyl alcohol dehydrogenase (cytochrome)